MLPGNLEGWLTNEGDRVVRAQVAGAFLSIMDRLIYEIWLLDTESRNGGLSQYFANRGRPQWRSCAHAASAGVTPSFLPFAAEVNRMIGDSDDPYQVINGLGRAAEDIWGKYD